MPGQSIPAAPDHAEPDPEMDARFIELNARVDAAYRAKIEREVRQEVAEEIGARRCHSTICQDCPCRREDAEIARGGAG